MARWVRERLDSRARQPQDGVQKAEGGGRKTEDGRQEPAVDNPQAAQKPAPPNPRTCYRCAYAQWMRLGPSALMVMDWLKHLICLNHPDAPGEFRAVLPTGTCPNFRPRREPPVRTPPPERVPPPEPPNGQVKFIALTKGRHTLVDAADFERLNRHKWFAMRSPNGSGYYAARWENGRMVLMHREILDAPDGRIVDHANRNPSDNRRCNLRLCTKQQNVFNRHSGVHSSRYQGVSYCKQERKWVAYIKLDKQHERLGGFDDEVVAAQVRDRWAFAFHGRFAYLNFPADFEGKDPNDPEFQALRDQLQEKRRKREARKKATEERQKEKGKR